MPLGNAGQAGERLAGQTPAHPQSLGALAKRGQERLLPFVRALGLRKRVGGLGRLVPAFASPRRAPRFGVTVDENGALFDKVRAPS